MNQDHATVDLCAEDLLSDCQCPLCAPDGYICGACGDYVGPDAEDHYPVLCPTDDDTAGVVRS